MFGGLRKRYVYLHRVSNEAAHKTYHIMKTSIFNISDNEREQKLSLEIDKTETYSELRLIEIGKDKTEYERIFLRITRTSDEHVEICMAEAGMVEHSSLGKVAGFPESVKIFIPAYLLPLFKKAVAQL